MKISFPIPSKNNRRGGEIGKLLIGFAVLEYCIENFYGIFHSRWKEGEWGKGGTKGGGDKYR